jgi:outer membrane protein
MKPKCRLMGTLLGAGMMFCSVQGHAEIVTLPQALEMSLKADPRIKEQEQVVEQARALLEEAQGNSGLRLDANMFVGLAPEVRGGFYEGGATSGTTPRNDGGSLHGVSDWTMLQFALVKPLYTFGKIERYSEAAQGNIDVKRGDVRLMRAGVAYDVKRAYYGYLTARDVRALLEHVQSQVDGAITKIERFLKQDNGQAKQSDLYAMKATQGLLGKYLAQAKAVEKVSLNGLKVLTGVGLKGELQVADSSLEPLPLPTTPLDDYQNSAIMDRPEMAQLEAGLRARRALVGAKKAEGYPNIYAGVIGTVAYASRRDRLNNPYVYDPFNVAAATPVVGVKWDTVFDVVPARVAQAQAELEALNYKNEFALKGIPFEVAEAYTQMHAYYQAQKDLADGAAAARRWMVSSYADFSAGLETADKVAEALKAYATTQGEYLRTVNDYNMYVAQMAKVTGSAK